VPVAWADSFQSKECSQEEKWWRKKRGGGALCCKKLEVGCVVKKCKTVVKTGKTVVKKNHHPVVPGQLDINQSRNKPLPNMTLTWSSLLVWHVVT
jgi:hypothetical protein